MKTALAPRGLLRVEGLAVLVLALTVFGRIGGNWLLFALLILAPDLSMLGYLAGPKTGATAYNIAHFYALPVILGAYGWWGGQYAALGIALIWAAHIGADRFLGFGLKYSTGFKDTHLQRI